jgi:hypothetical protein
MDWREFPIGGAIVADEGCGDAARMAQAAVSANDAAQAGRLAQEFIEEFP